MKKVLFLAALLLVCFSGVTNAQTRKQREDAKREAWKKERQEKKALEAQQDSVSFMKAIDALKNGSFVLEADNVVFRNGMMFCVLKHQLCGGKRRTRNYSDRLH